MNHLKKIFTITLVTCLVSTPASAMDAPKVAIIEAAEKGNLTKVTKILKKDKTQVNKADENGFTALMLAAYSGHLDCVKALIAAGAKVDQANKNGATALILGATKCNYVFSVSNLRKNKALCLDALIAANTEIDKTNNNGETALICAAQYGHTDCIQALIAAEADTAYALRFVIKFHNLQKDILKEEKLFKIINNLLGCGVNVNMPITSRNSTVLYRAAEKGIGSIVAKLLSRQANANQARADGKTPLMIAAHKGHIDIVNMLINLQGLNAVDVNAKAAEYHNVSALYLAALNGKQDVVELLLRSGANANIAADNGWTPLMAAANMGHTEIVELLLQHGADHTLKSVKGYTAHDFASRKNHTPICDLLASKNSRTEKSRSVQNNNNE